MKTNHITSGISSTNWKQWLKAQHGRNKPKYECQAKHRLGIRIILICLATRVYSILKDESKDISNTATLIKQYVRCLFECRISGQPRQNHIRIEEGNPRDKGKR